MLAKIKVLHRSVALSVIAAATVSVWAAPVAAASYALDLIPSSQQISQFNRGTEMIDSPYQNTTIRLVECASEEKNTVCFKAIILNKGSESIVFGPNNVVVKTIDQQPIALITYEQMLAVERRRQKTKQFGAGLAAFGRAMSASEGTQGSGRYSGSSSGWVGNDLVTTHTTGTFSYNQSDPAAELAAQQNAQRMNASDQAQLQERWAKRLESLEAVLRTNTVLPEVIYGGIVSFSVPPAIKKAKGSTPVIIEVEVAGERHAFSGHLFEAK